MKQLNDYLTFIINLQDFTQIIFEQLSWIKLIEGKKG